MREVRYRPIADIADADICEHFERMRPAVYRLLGIQLIIWCVMIAPILVLSMLWFGIDGAYDRKNFAMWAFTLLGPLLLCAFLYARWKLRQIVKEE